MPFRLTKMTIIVIVHVNMLELAVSKSRRNSLNSNWWSQTSIQMDGSANASKFWIFRASNRSRNFPQAKKKYMQQSLHETRCKRYSDKCFSVYHSFPPGSFGALSDFIVLSCHLHRPTEHQRPSLHSFCKLFAWIHMFVLASFAPFWGDSFTVVFSSINYIKRHSTGTNKRKRCWM